MIRSKLVYREIKEKEQDMFTDFVYEELYKPFNWTYEKAKQVLDKSFYQYGVFDNNVLIASTALNESDGMCQINSIAVDELYRGKGIATQMFNDVAQYAYKKNFQKGLIDARIETMLRLLARNYSHRTFLG